MSSEEDFSLVTDTPQPLEDTLEGVLALINNYKKKQEQLLVEQKELAGRRDDLRDMAQQFRLRTEKVTRVMEEDKRYYTEEIETKEAQLNELMQEEAKLMEEIKEVKAALMEEEIINQHLKKKTEVFRAVPERTVVFKGTTKEPSNGPTFEMDSKIVYPMEGGTALVTFEDAVVANKILHTKTHKVDLGEECFITLEAKQVHMMVPSVVEIESEVCPRRILISNLPTMIDTDTLLNKLEIHFSKKRNRGGEVEHCELLRDSWTVVLTFVEEGIVKGLTDEEYHEVEIQKKKMHKVRVTPFLNGNITNLETEMSLCPRTVLLTGIPVVMEQETLQDLLEIHFQKSTNGGGEIEAFLYNPLGQHILAEFVGLSHEEEEEEEE